MAAVSLSIVLRGFEFLISFAPRSPPSGGRRRAPYGGLSTMTATRLEGGESRGDPSGDPHRQRLRGCPGWGARVIRASHDAGLLGEETPIRPASRLDRPVRRQIPRRGPGAVSYSGPQELRATVEARFIAPFHRFFAPSLRSQPIGPGRRLAETTETPDEETSPWSGRVTGERTWHGQPEDVAAPVVRSLCGPLTVWAGGRTPLSPRPPGMIFR